tara:strand:- start:886 stop:1431 length:546 start_codon:yes stop_codon:yes gene_type:complete
MEIDVILKLLAPIFTGAVGLIVKGYIEAKPKLILYLVHASAIPLNDEKNTNVNTHSIVVRNTGKKTANNVRIGHNYLPKSYQLYPKLTHEVKEGANSSSEILIPTLVPGEEVNISYLYFPPDTYHNVNSYCKSDEVSARPVSVIPAPHLNKFQLVLIWSLIFIGASTTVYAAFLAILAWAK